MGTIFKIFTLLLLASACEGNHQLNITNLRCEQQVDPIGLDSRNPRFSWVLESNHRGAKQTAYQILVASSLKKLNANTGDIWDSKKTVSNQTIQIEYKGKKLSSEGIYYWKVRVWDEQGDVSDWATSARWEMGLLNQSDWRAAWINAGRKAVEDTEEFYADDPAPLFRRDFTIDKKIEQARLYISGLGYYEATINCERVGDHHLDPGWTNYSKRVLYSTYDVTELIKNGGNSIGVMLGNGWYNPLPMTMWGYLNLREHLTIGQPQFIAQLKISYADGTTQTIVSNEEWRTHEGPIIRNNIYLGEIYDARKEIDGWDSFGFDDSQWSNAKVAKVKLGNLQAQNQPPIKIRGKLSPVKLTEPKPGVYIFDMGQNYAGWAKLKVEASAGTRIKLRYGELLYQDGTLNGLTSVAGQIKGKNADGALRGGAFSPDTAWQSDIYISSGKGIEYYTPRFTFHSFRYVEVTGYPGRPPMDAIEGLRLSSDLQKTGSFECSNKLFNDIQKMTEWTFLSNVFSVQSDCPHRERFGYGGDIAVTTDAFIYNFDMSGFYAKAVRDFQDAAHPNGMLTDTAPFVGIEFCGIGWALAHPLMLLELYQYYGDVSLIEEQYETARKWFELVISENDLIITHGLSDHESLAPIPSPEMVTPLYYQSAVMMSELAKIIDRKDDAAKYKNLAKEIKEVYLEKFLEKGEGRFAPFTQGSQSFALYTGITPKNEIENAVSELAKNIEDHDGHLTTGIYGTKYSLDVLSKNGYAEIASKMVSQEGFPGWDNMLVNGATTLWEHWEFSDNTYSHNHPMFGSVSEWFYKWVAGIQADSSAVGFDKITIRPQIISNVKWVKAHYNSVRGKIISEWKRDENSFNLNITIPVNSTATVYLPADDITKIMEGGADISGVKDVEFLKMENGNAVFTVGSGNYSFEIKLIGANHTLTSRKFQGIPSLAITPEGRLWATWYAGKTPDEDQNNYVVIASSKDNGKTWTENLIIDPDAEGPVRAFDPELWVDPEGRLWSFWAQTIGHDGTIASVWTRINEDPDRVDSNWSQPRRLTDGIMMCKPTVLSSGEWILPASTWRDTDNSARVVVSTDRGQNFSLRGACNVPVEVRNYDEHMIIERKDRSLWMLVRTKYGIGESISKDRGETWSTLVPSPIQHPSARFFIRRLCSGTLLLVKHGPINERTGRSHLTAYLSEDDGQTWSGGLLLDERSGVSYPDGQQSPDGTIHIIYDYSRTDAREILMATFNEEDVVTGNRASATVSLRMVVSKFPEIENQK